MAEKPRPPSEQGPEYRALDAIEELARRVEELAQRPAYAAPSNWWDVLNVPPVSVSGRSPRWQEILAQTVQCFILGGTDPMWRTVLRVQVMVDRIELSLRLLDQYTIWERALFFEGRPA